MARKARRWKEDADLVRACLDGSQEGWDELLRRYRRLIYSIPVAYRLPPDQADEVFQRVALKLFENLDTLRSHASLPSWLSITTRRECWALSRERWREREADDDLDRIPVDPPDLADALDAVDREHALALAFERLDDPCRTLLTALYLEDPAPSYRQLAERLGRPVGSLGPTRQRCLGKLQRLFLRAGGSTPAASGSKR